MFVACQLHLSQKINGSSGDEHCPSYVPALGLLTPSHPVPVTIGRAPQEPGSHFMPPGPRFSIRYGYFSAHGTCGDVWRRLGAGGATGVRRQRLLHVPQSRGSPQTKNYPKAPAAPRGGTCSQFPRRRASLPSVPPSATHSSAGRQTDHVASHQQAQTKPVTRGVSPT